jgi:hypothetical protein
VVEEEAQEAPDVVIGMFLIHDTYAVVLFDFGASHSFIFPAYAGKLSHPKILISECEPFSPQET